MCDAHHSAPERPELIDVSKLDRRDLLRGLASGTVVLVAGCATNPVTGRSQFILVDESQLAQASLQAWAQVRQQTPTWTNAAAQRRLETVGNRIVQAAGRGNQRWEFVLFDSPEKNAFVLPGGQVGFYRGLMEICGQRQLHRHRSRPRSRPRHRPPRRRALQPRNGDAGGSASRRHPSRATARWPRLALAPKSG